MLEASGLQQWKDQHVSQGKGEEHHHALYHYTRVPGLNILHRLSKTTFVFDSLAGFERKNIIYIYICKYLNMNNCKTLDQNHDISCHLRGGYLVLVAATATHAVET